MDFNKEKSLKIMRIFSKVTWNLVLLFLLFCLSGLFFAGGAGAGYFASLIKDEPIRSYDSMKKDIYNYEETTELYFKDQIYLGKLRSDLDREEIKLEQVSKHVINGIIATEDENFYEHSGVVPKAILRAVLQEVTNSDVKTGGSTVTQQLIKNQILTNEVSFERKAKEIMIALRLERFFEKDEIMEAYLNVVPFGRNSSGRNIAGIQTAALGIFGVDASELNLAQSAYIAGLPQSPSAYTPFTSNGEIKQDLSPSLTRMKTVLNRMLSAGYISEAEYKDALAYDIKANLTPPKPNPIQDYPWLTYEIEDRSKEILMKVLAVKDGYSEEDLKNDDHLYNEYYMKADKNLRQNGYRIYSTIDKEIYDKMQQIKDDFQYYGNDKPEKVTDPDTNETKTIMEPVEVGGILIDNATGAIISFVGGRDHEKQQLNHATKGLRSNGSTMKPILVFAPALELGRIHPGSPIPDVELRIKAGSSIWEPKNYSQGYSGLTSARYALAKSYNIPAAKIYSSIIDQDPTQYLQKMGFTSLTAGDKSHLSMSLGALERGVTIEENTNAFATFANKGKFIDAYMIERIETKDGEIVYEHQVKPVDVFTPQTSYLTIDMMRDVINSGTAAGLPSKLKFKSDWAGKTGTSQDYSDTWLVATNPKVTFGVWMGYDTPKPLERSYKGYSYGQRNQMIWANLINAVYDLKPELVHTSNKFEMPGGIVRRSYCAVSGMLPSDLCNKAGLVKSDLFNSQFIPTEMDNSLITGSFSVVKDKYYKVTDDFPKDFVSTGVMLNPDYLSTGGLSDVKNVNQLIPKGWGSIIIPEKEPLQDNGTIPSQIKTIQLENNILSWAAHPDTDVVGYRVYKSSNSAEAFSRIASLNDTTHTISNSNASYYVTAVDVAGNESSPSPTVSGFDWQNDEQPIEEPSIPSEDENSEEIKNPSSDEPDILNPLNRIRN